MLTIVVPSGTPAPTRTVTTIAGASVPAATVSRSHCTTVSPVQVHPVPAAETRLSPAGSASVTVTASASEGPSLCTTIVNAVVSPALTGLSPVVVLVSEMLALSVITVGSWSVLLSGSTSVSGPVTSAMLISVAGPASGATFATSVMSGAAAFWPRPAARVQSTDWPDPVQTQPVPLADAYVIPSGSASWTVTGPAAADGPLLRTARV